MGGTREEIAVPVVTLDLLLDAFPPPNFIKIDVEGAEVLALRGAKRLLEATQQPSLYIEVAGDKAPEVTEILHGAGYRIFDALLRPNERVPLQRCVFDTLALPTISESNP
jgi:hypothetical protein